jgi:putative ABC transport system permease protein
VAGAFSKASMLRNMQEVSARNVRIMSTVLTLFAAVIAVGVVYNNARIALAERTWELASLRVLGFTRGEVSALLLGELALASPGAAAGHGAGLGLVHLLAGCHGQRPVPVSGGDPAAHLCLGGLCVVAGRHWPARWWCAGASTGWTWWRPQDQGVTT